MHKTPVLFIHGGNVYPTHKAFIKRLKTKEIDLERMRPSNKWTKVLQKTLGEDYDVLFASMPTSDDAQYDEWKLWYERIIEAIGEPCILIGHSLGAMFLSKYYSENEPKYSIPLLLLISSAHLPKTLPAEEQTSFTLQEDLGILTKHAERVVFFHSEDDFVVPYSSFEQYKKEVSDAEFMSFTDRGHFLDETFPELIDVVHTTHIQ